MYTYHLRFISEGVAENSQVITQNTHISLKELTADVCTPIAVYLWAECC
jgi:hypothetical protein